MDNEDNFQPLVFVSGKDRSLHSTDWVHSTGHNKWKGWYCAAGMRTLYIDFDGNVFIGTCGVGGWYGNIFRQGLAPDKHLNEWVKCPLESCACGSDMYAPKVRSKSLIPKNMYDLYAPARDFLDKGNAFRDVSQVEDPEVVTSLTTCKQKVVIWDLGRRCNYSCSYCYPDSHNNYEAHKSLGSLQHAVQGLHDWWLCGEPAYFVITGGEPTLHPQYLEFARFMVEKGHRLHTTTNGSRDAKFYSELIALSQITFWATWTVLRILALVSDLWTISASVFGPGLSRKVAKIIFCRFD